MKLSREDFWGLAFRFFLGGIFVLAGFSKLMEPVENFRGAIADYQLLPYALVPWVAQVFPWLELFFGFFMLAGYLPRLTGAVLASFSSIFILFLTASDKLLSGAGQNCGCFGQNGFIRLTVWQVALLDLAILAAGIYLARRKSFPFSLDAWLRKS